MSDDDKDFPDWLKQWAEIEAGDHDCPEIEPRDYTLSLLDEFDIEAQLIAIKSLLKRNRDDEARTRQDIQELDRYIRDSIHRDPEYQVHLENQWVDELHSSVFQDAAHSMAAVGMLAPFVESLFVAIFQKLRAKSASVVPIDKRREIADEFFWNPRRYFADGQAKENTAAGIQQLAKSIGLKKHLPRDYGKCLNALLTYRNFMFHNGFEWPIDRRRDFAKQMQGDGWPEDWFKTSKSGGEVWIFYMSDVFIRHCIEVIEGVLDGVGAYLKEQNA